MSALRGLHARLVFNRRTRVLSEHLDPLLPEGASILDVGCGDGTIAYRLMKRRPDLSIQGLDVARRPVTHIPVALFDGKSIPMESGASDFVMLVDVLHHTTDAAGLLRECARVAKHGLLIKDHLCESMFDRVTLRLMDWVGNAPHGVGLPYAYISRDEWWEMFRELSLSVEEWTEDIRLYPRPLSWMFGRNLHVLTRLGRSS